jgi:hypothetical protein
MVVEASRLGEARVLQKPITPAQLVALLESAP